MNIRLVLLALLLVPAVSGNSAPIDRHALVTRHNVVLTAADVHSPLSVGNGEFAFTADVTGLQTFEGDYNHGIPLSTMAQWGFHTMPNPQGFSLEKFPLTTNDTGGRAVGYLYYENGKSPPERRAAADYLYDNPSRLNLGRLALVLKSTDGHEVRLADLKDIHQELNLWTGELRSHFSLDGEPVDMLTCCHPDRELVAVQIHSVLISEGRLSVLLAFPYGSASFAGNGADWGRPEAHQTVMRQTGDRRADFTRTLDNDRYYAALAWSEGIHLTPDGPHRYLLAGKAQTIEFVAAFSQSVLPAKLPDATATQKA